MHMHYVKTGLTCLAVSASLARGFGGVILQDKLSEHVGSGVDMSRACVRSVQTNGLKCLSAEMSWVQSVRTLRTQCRSVFWTLGCDFETSSWVDAA